MIDLTDIIHFSCQLSVNYIAYFYHVFPLYLNSFNSLFTEVINPKLLYINSYVLNLILFHSYLSNPITSLQLSFSFQFPFGHITDTFESIVHPFIVSLKENLDTSISQFDLTTTTDIINLILYSIICKFHENFKSISNEISTKLSDHINQIDDKIKSIITEINRELKIVEDQTKSTIDIITTNLDYLKQNNSYKFDQYNIEEELMKTEIQISENKLGSLRFMYNDLSDYKRRLGRYNSINSSLSQLKTKLESFNSNVKSICSSIQNYDTKPNYLSEMHRYLITFNLVKDVLIPELNSYKGDFSALQQIGRHIHFLKIAQRNLEKELDSQFSTSVKSLQNIDIKETQIHTLTMTMNTQIDYIIRDLQLLKSMLQYRDSLKIILTYVERLPSLIKCKVGEFLENSRNIVQTLSDASKTIETSKQKIEELKKKHRYLSKHVPGDLESNLKSYISQIPGIIKEASLYLRIVRYIIYYLQIIKCNSTNSIAQVKIKMCQISDLSSELTKLKEVYHDMIIFYRVHLKTTFFLNFYSGLIDINNEFEKQLNKINQIIYETPIFIYLISFYYTFMYHINVIVNNMSKVKGLISDINKLNEDFKAIRLFVSIIINKLSDLNSNITRLESNMSEISPDNLKDKIIYYKYRVVMVKEDIESLVNTFEGTRSYIKYTVKELKAKCKDITEEIQKSIVYLSRVILVQPFVSLPMYIINAKIGNGIFSILSQIKNYLQRIKLIIELNIRDLNSKVRSMSSNTLILKLIVKQIKSNINQTESSIGGLECAIEGIVRNLIRCILQFLRKHVITFNYNNSGANYSNIIKMCDRLIVNIMINTTCVSDGNMINTNSSNDI